MAATSFTPPSDAHNPQMDLLNALSALRVTGRYSDLTITCNYRQWAVHKAIVCSRSGFFDGACSSPFQEASSGVIDLSEEDEEAVEQMIQFLYHLDYLKQEEQATATAFQHRARSAPKRNHSNSKSIDLSHIEDPLLSQAGTFVQNDAARPSTPPDSRTSIDLAEGKSESPKARPPTPQLEPDNASDHDSLPADDIETASDSYLLLHTRVYALAEKYDIPSLKAVARSKFETAMACYYDSPEFPQAIEEVYCSTIDSDRGLRDIVLLAFRNHPQLAQTQDVFSVINDVPSLALELFKIERGIPV